MTQIFFKAPAQTQSFTSTMTTLFMGAVVVMVGALTFAVPYLA